jgi:hypothetical protein
LIFLSWIKIDGELKKIKLKIIGRLVDKELKLFPKDYTETLDETDFVASQGCPTGVRLATPAVPNTKSQ